MHPKASRLANTHEGQRRFLALEGLRGVSALAIVFMHLGGWGAGLFRHGYLAVDLFFIISGVVIAHAYEARLQSGWPSLAFVGVRIKRLAPLYLAGAVLGAACSLLAHHLGYGGDGLVLFNLPFALLFIPLLFGAGELYPLNPPSWSLFAELCANLGYGAVAKTLSRTTLIVLTLLGAAAVAMVTLRSSVDANVGVSAGNWFGGLARVCFGFPAGVLLYRLHASGRLHMPRLSAPLAVAMAAISFVAPVHGPAYDLIVILALYPALVGAALASPVKGTAMSAAFVTAGAISYPLYALHYPLAKLARLYIPATGLGAALAIPACVAALVLIAYAALRLFDQPLQSWLKRARPSAPASVAT